MELPICLIVPLSRLTLAPYFCRLPADDWVRTLTALLICLFYAKILIQSNSENIQSQPEHKKARESQ